MGKHESSSSPAKSPQEKIISERSSISKNLQEYQQERIVNHNINTAIDSKEIVLERKRVQIYAIAMIIMNITAIIANQ